ncbi:MAG: hypothetical protein E2576_27560 [Alcaligenaceae bacterium]|nr:hypothetical protein [Alcaligenaceae bacterium SAGV5]MPS52603.1 hypothetical protein [Alcaligenaceae bacterium SAGV3]MPT60494.1 hypothetical protein [Alcaligenaceae bacterium]
MLEGFKIYDADAHVLMTPEMWETLPKQYWLRRPRPVKFGDGHELGNWGTGWLVDGRIEPHPFGPGTHAANTPGMVLEEYGANRARAGDFTAFSLPVGCVTMGDVADRLTAMDKLGIDVQVLFPSTIYATISADATLEGELFRAYNRYIGTRCRDAAKRLRWVGLLPMRDAEQARLAMKEMVDMGAAAAVVFGTVGDRMLSHPSFEPIWNEFTRTGLPLCVHMAMSFPPLAQLCESIQDANMIGKAMPAQLAFMAMAGHGMLDKYPSLKVAFLEFGGEWIFYSVGRMKQYAEVNKGRMADPSMLPKSEVDDLVKSGRIYLGPESSDAMLAHELKLLGDGQLLYSSDFPHGEGRDNAAMEIIERQDLTKEQKRKFLYDNAANFYGEP